MNGTWGERLQLSKHERRTLALSLRPIAGRDPMKLWFQGRERYFDLFVDYDAQGLCWFQLTLRGCALTWENGKLWAGHTREARAFGWPSSSLIDPAGDADELARIVAELLSARRDEPFAELLAHLPKVPPPLVLLD